MSVLDIYVVGILCINHSIAFNETKKAQLSSGSKSECMYSTTGMYICLLIITYCLHLSLIWGPTNEADHENKTFLILFVITLFISLFILSVILGFILVNTLKKQYRGRRRRRHQSQEYHSIDTCYGEI